MNISLLYNVFLGEISPLIAARVDSPAYEMGARRMENMIPMLTGGLRKRPGTWYDGTTRDNRKARLIDWLLSDGTCIVLELTAGVIRVWKQYQVTQEIKGAYAEEHLGKLQYAASADNLWIVHQDLQPMKLTWNGREVVTTLPMFEGKDFTTAGNRPGAVAFDAGRLCLAGTKKEPNRIYMSRSPDSQTGEARHTDFTPCTTYFTPKQNTLVTKLEVMTARLKTFISGQEAITSRLGSTMDGTDDLENVNAGIAFLENVSTELIILAAKLEAQTARQESFTAEMRAATGELEELASELKGLTGRLQGVILELRDMAGSIGPSIMDAREAYSYVIAASIISSAMLRVKTGIERQVALLNEMANEQEILAAKLEAVIYRLPNIDMEETKVVLASDSIVLEENDMHGSRIQWIAGNRKFLAATERATWSDTGDIPTPATFDMNIVEYAGANGLQAKGSKEIMVYAGRDGRTLRALVWNENTQGSGYIDMDISGQAAHLFGSGIRDFAVADYPYPMLWIVTNAGELVSCTANIRGGILAYARHPTDGAVESVAVAAQGERDVLFLVVKRGEARNVEHLFFEDLVNDDFSEGHYVDAGERRTYDTPTKAITGLKRFAGKTIRAFADGATEPPVGVSKEGEAEMQTAATKVHLGLPYKAAFSPNERQIPANGTSLGKKRRIERITLKLYKSLGGRAGTTEEKSTELITQRFGGYVLGSAPEPFTGELDVTVSGNIDTEGKLVVTHDEPVPFTMLALVERVALLEA
jgi:hypothetical protein